MAKVAFTTALNDEYEELFTTCQIRPERAKEVNGLATTIERNRDRYQSVADELGIPWYIVGVIHGMEASFNFTRHLHNGDPLTARTVHVPANRPASGQPPFTWEESATDALRLAKLDQVEDWTVPQMLYQLEGYNGFGYRLRHPEVLTPYLWSYSQHYTKGKFVADGTFSATAVSKQCGAAVMLRRMAETGVVEFKPDGTPITQVDSDTGSSDAMFNALGPLVTFSATKKLPAVENLQRMLNTFPGIFVKVDGIAGPKTSDAFRKVTGHFLTGDPRAGK